MHKVCSQAKRLQDLASRVHPRERLALAARRRDLTKDDCGHGLYSFPPGVKRAPFVAGSVSVVSAG
jgi:hypothetical protein